VVVDLLLLVVSIVAYVTDAEYGGVHDFLLDGQVPVLDPGLGVVGIEPADAETARQEAGVIGVDDGIRRIHSRDVLRRRPQTVVGQAIRRESGVADRVLETG